MFRPVRARTRLLQLATCAVVLLASAPAFAGTPKAELIRRFVPRKPAHATIAPGYSHETLHIKFREGAAVRLRGGTFASIGRDDVAGLSRVLARFPGIKLERLFERPEAVLALEKARIEALSGREQADKNLYFRARLPKGINAVEVINAFNELDIVEIAYAEPLPMPAPGHTPDFESEQFYLGAAIDGINAAYAGTQPGGNGSNVRIIDIEYSWNQSHEDLSKAGAALIPNKTPSDPFSSNNHGTAVVGELVADDNGFGVTGATPGAALGLVNANNVEDGYDLADSIDIAHAALNAGDVILLEQQIAGPNGCTNSVSGCVAVEWVQAFYDAIVAATSDGIIVVEAAGNGNENLDDTATYGSPFPDGRPDSGAIIVGSANAPGCTTPQHGRIGSSTFGARVNLHAYGECITTTGYGDRQGGSDPNEWYTSSFSGTSGASPIVTSAAAALSSLAQQQGDADGLNSTEARAFLQIGATPQELGSGANAGNIGPMPNLAQSFLLYVPTAIILGPLSTPEGTDLVLDGSASFDPNGSPLTYAWDFNDNGIYADASGPNPTFTNVGRDGTFPISLKVTDPHGAWSTWDAVVTVQQVAPSVGSLSANDPVSEGSLYSLSGLISDPGWQDPLSGTVAWGDGSSNAASGPEEHDRPLGTISFSNGHTYGDNGTYTVSVCGIDDDDQTCVNRNASVNNVAPSVSIDPAQVLSIPEGGTLNVTAMFSDPGWLDTYTAEIDWGTGAPAEAVTPVVTASGPPQDVGLVSTSHVYGDNGVYHVVVRVTDDDGGVGQASFNVTVGNVDPTAVIDLTGSVVVDGVETFIAHAGETVDFNARSEDPGSDDLLLTWDWGDGAPSPDTSRNSLVNPPVADGPQTPTVQPRDELEPRSHAFGDACLYSVTFASADDDGASASDQVSVVITGNATERRSAGYWYNQYRALPTSPTDIPLATQECYLLIVDHMSTVFNTTTDASTRPLAAVVLHGTGPDPRAKLDRELLAAWANFANGAFDLTSVVDTDGDGTLDTQFATVMANAEAVRLDPMATPLQVLQQKDILQRINR